MVVRVNDWSWDSPELTTVSLSIARKVPWRIEGSSMLTEGPLREFVMPGMAPKMIPVPAIAMPSKTNISRYAETPAFPSAGKLHCIPQCVFQQDRLARRM